MQWEAGSRGGLTLLWTSVLKQYGISSPPVNSVLNFPSYSDYSQKFTGPWTYSARVFGVWRWSATHAGVDGENSEIPTEAGQISRLAKGLALEAENHELTFGLGRRGGLKVERKAKALAPLAMPNTLAPQKLHCGKYRLGSGRNKKTRNSVRSELVGEQVREARTAVACKSARTSNRVQNAAWDRPFAVDAYVRNRQLRFLAQTEHLKESLCTFEQELFSCRRPDSYTIAYFIKGLCKAGDVPKALNVFRRRFAQCARFDGVDTLVCNVMIDELGKAGHIDDAMNLAQEMTERGWLPDIYTYNSIICGLGNVGRVDDALAFLVTISSNSCEPDLVSYNSLISALGKAGRYMEAYDLYDRMVESGCRPDLVTFNTLLTVLCKAGKVSVVNDLFKFMKQAGWEPDVYTYTPLSVSLCRAGRVDEALQLSVEMTEKGCAPNTATFNSWLDGLCKEDRVAEAILLWQEMLRLGYRPDNITYSILIDASCRTTGLLDQSFTLLKHLTKSTEHLDCRTSDIVFRSFDKVGMLKQAKRIARNARAKKKSSN